MAKCFFFQIGLYETSKVQSQQFFLVSVMIDWRIKKSIFLLNCARDSFRKNKTLLKQNFLSLFGKIKILIKFCFFKAFNFQLVIFKTRNISFRNISIGNNLDIFPSNSRIENFFENYPLEYPWKFRL